MPDPYERHGRSKREWDTPGPRSQQRAAAADDEKLPKVPGKKDPAKCKGNRGGPHEPEKALKSGKPCGWYPSYSRRAGEFGPSWICWHEVVCRHCGLVMRRSIPSGECPGYSEEIPDETAEEIRKWQERYEGSRAKPRTEKPRTGYRKPKAK